MLTGNKVTLTPAEIKDKEAVYQWCFHSETTKYHSGPPSYPNAPIATEAEFFEDYQEYYFTGAQPQNGRGFLILHAGEPIGFISYSSFHLTDGIAELDIWLNREVHCGKGFGTDAIVTLGDHLHETFGIQKLMMRPSRKILLQSNLTKRLVLRNLPKTLLTICWKSILLYMPKGIMGQKKR